MKFTLSWLKDHLDTTATLDEIVEGLIGVGLEVEEVADSAQFDAFTVAHVTLAEKHPNADKLRQCVVETKDGVKQVVCGAPNARTGIKAIVALPGVTIPATGTVFAPATIRGVESQAMLCSERELLLSEEHDGIIEVDEKWPVGTPAAVALGLDDPMIYVKVTANRPDALGIHGIARDLAAKGLGKLKPLKADPVKGSFKSPISVSLDFADGDTKACPLFVGRYFKKREEWPLACLDAEAAARHWLAAHLGARRHHQLRDLRLCAAAACVRRQEGEGQHPRARGKGWRNARSARQQDLHALRRHDGDCG